MKKSKNPWLIYFLIFVLTKTRADQLCKRSENCQCLNNSDHYEYQCSENLEEEAVIIHVYPNSLIKIDCYQIESLDIEKLPKVKFENIQKLSIRFCPVPQNGINSIAEHFGMKNVNVLAFESGFFENFTMKNEDFTGLENVTVLQLRGNELKRVENGFFNNFPKLVSLELDTNQLQLEGNIFAPLKDLKFLSLSDNKIEELPNDVFSGLQNLQNLILWKNKLKIINEQSFKDLQKLKSLEIAYNKLETIEDSSFNNLPNLVNVSVRNNLLGNLSKKIFEFNTILEQFEAGGNPNIQLEDAVFSNLKKLKIVNLSNCKLKKIPENLFENSEELQNIILENNEIQQIPKNTFKNLRNLKILSLKSNKIDVLDDDAFANLNSLETLNMRNNQLSEINAKIFRDLKTLKEINLSFNRIKKIHLNAFSRCRKLIKIFLSHNNYSYEDESFYPSSPFNKCPELEEIDLSHNEILDFPQDLMYLVAIKNIDLSWNNLTWLNVNALWKVTLNELKIDLEHNNISRLNFKDVEITAQQQPLDAYHNVGASAVIKISNNPIICDCFAYDFVRYLSNEMFPGVKTSIFFVYDNVTCSAPQIFNGFPIESIKTDMLTCPMRDIVKNFTCTDNENCECHWRPHDSSFIVYCGNKKLKKIPQIFQPEITIFNQTEVHLQGNRLEKGPSESDAGYGNVSKLFLGGNLISEIEWLPPNIQFLDLMQNKLQALPFEILETLNSTNVESVILDGNPWKCDCAMSNFTNFLRENVRKIESVGIVCDKTNKLLINLNEKDLCPHSFLLLASATTFILILCVLSSLAAFYYKYQQEIKVWMYAHNFCLFLIEEEELDKDKVYDAFVSYSHKDEDFVIENLISILEDGPRPYKLCLHFRNWIPGEFIATQVTKSVTDSRRTMVILSPNFLDSVWGKMEFRTAHTEAMREGRARVIIVLYGDVDIESLDDELKSYMKTNTYIKWGDPWFWDKLKYALPHSKHKINALNTQKQANMMKYIEDKFAIIDGKKDCKLKIEDDEIDDNANRHKFV